jgi:hypothetical protein
MERSSRSVSKLNEIELTELPAQIWGPWRNHWGYVTTIAQFSPDDILLKSIRPNKTKVIKYFSDWEDCADYVELIEQDRRF